MGCGLLESYLVTVIDQVLVFNVVSSANHEHNRLQITTTLYFTLLYNPSSTETDLGELRATSGSSSIVSFEEFGVEVSILIGLGRRSNVHQCVNHFRHRKILLQQTRNQNSTKTLSNRTVYDVRYDAGNGKNVHVA